MSLYTRVDKEIPDLHTHHWPPVEVKTTLSEDALGFLNADMTEKQVILARKKTEPTFPEFLHKTLSMIYAYVFGYEDSITYIHADDLLESNLYSAKIVLERELLDHWLEINLDFPHDLNQSEAANYLYKLSKYNPAVNHPLFEYISSEASANAMQHFLFNEVIRNEVVDDEVAFLSVGFQGMMKNVAVANLWDECGQGTLKNFHTYWLRRLLTKNGTWEQLMAYRQEQPWFFSIMSNTFNMLTTRSPYKFQAFGEFLITEGFVAPHFIKILKGLERTKLNDDDITVYFKSHVIVDPNHTMEMATAIKEQKPKLTQDKINKIIQGSHVAIAAAMKQYDLSLRYLKRLHEVTLP